MRVRSLSCPKCGGRTKIAHGETQASCLHCGNPVKLSDAALQEQQTAVRFPPTTPLRLGMKGSMGGREYEAAGRQVMQQVDEGVTYTWEEWVLIAPDGDLLYLEFDEGKWKISKPFVPKSPVGPAQLRIMTEGSVLTLEGGSLVTDCGEYRIVHAEGEFPFLVTPGKRVGFVDAAAGAEIFSVEWTEDAVEYYRGRLVDHRQIYTAFSLHEELRALDARETALKSRRKFGGLCLACSLAALLGWGVSLGSGVRASNGYGTVPLQQALGEGVRYGPIKLTAVDRVHRLEVRGQMREESNWVQAILEDEQEQELISAERDMWDESGSDSDGYWHESDLRGSSDFVLKKPGNYYVRLFSEPEPGRAPSPGATAVFELKEKALYPTYLSVFGFTMLALGFFFLCSGSPQTMQKLKESAQTSDDD